LVACADCSKVAPAEAKLSTTNSKLYELNGPLFYVNADGKRIQVDNEAAKKQGSKIYVQLPEAPLGAPLGPLARPATRIADGAPVQGGEPGVPAAVGSMGLLYAELRGYMLEAAKEGIGQKPVGPYGLGTGYDTTPLDAQSLLALGNPPDNIGSDLALTVVSTVDMTGIEVWKAKERIADQLAQQRVLVNRSPLRWVPVEDGLQFISHQVGGFLNAGLSREQFVQTCLGLLLARRVPHTLRDRDELFDVFDSIDLDRNGFLSLGEWAGALTVYFQGTLFECVQAVFHTLDKDKSNTVSKSELMEYVKPLVKAMTPPEAEALRPMLLAKCTDDLFNEMDPDQSGEVTLAKMLAWADVEQSLLAYATGVVDKVAYTIELEVYRLWIHHKFQQARQAQKQGSQSGKPQGRQQAQPIETPAQSQRVSITAPANTRRAQGDEMENY
jgi:Ca2+-binding EF-hand superfamily protein